MYFVILLTWTIKISPNPCLSLMWFSGCDHSSDIVTKVTWDYINNCINNFEAKMRWSSLSNNTGYMDAVIILFYLSAKFKNEIVSVSCHYQAFWSARGCTLKETRNFTQSWNIYLTRGVHQTIQTAKTAPKPPAK